MLFKIPWKITLTYRAVDGTRMQRKYKTLKGARAFAHSYVGENAEVFPSSTYATSRDGVGILHKDGCAWSDLFPGMERGEL